MPVTRWTAICALLASGCTAVVGDVEPPEERSSASSLVTSGVSNGYLRPANQQGVGDAYMFYTPYAPARAEIDQRYGVFADWQIGVKNYNFFWGGFEPSADAHPSYRSSADTVPSCPSGYAPFPANADQKRALGFNRYHCYHQPGIEMYDANFTRDAALGIQSTVVLWRAPSQHVHPGCTGHLDGAGLTVKDECVPWDNDPSDGRNVALEDWHDFVRFIATRYNGTGRGKVHHYIVWNEVGSSLWTSLSPMVSAENPAPSDADIAAIGSYYATLFRTAYDAVRGATSGVLMHVSLDNVWGRPWTTIAGKTHIGGSSVLERMWIELGTAYDWSVAFHPYGDPVTDGRPNEINFAELETVIGYQRAQLAARGLVPDAHPQAYLFASEQGWQQSIGIDMQARNICMAHHYVTRLPNVVGVTHNGLQNLPPPFGTGVDTPDSWALIPISAGIGLIGGKNSPTFRAYEATGLSQWGRNDVHYCCANYLVGCRNAAGGSSVRGGGAGQMADFTGDGRADFADHYTATGSFWIHENRGASFAPPGDDWAWGTTSAGPLWDTLAGRFDPDPYADFADLVTVNGHYWVHRNRGYRTAFDGRDWAWGVLPWGPHVEHLTADFNADGLTDVAVHNVTTGGIGLYSNRGLAGADLFVPLQANAGRSAVGAAWRLLVGDFNADGYADFIDHHTPSGQFWVHSNGGAASGFTFSASDIGWYTAAGWDASSELVIGEFTGASIADSARVADYAVRNTSTGTMRVYAGTLSGGRLSFQPSSVATATTAAPAPWRLLGQ
jgi:hypothetical protein